MSNEVDNKDTGAFASESENTAQEGLTKREYFAIEIFKKFKNSSSADATQNAIEAVAAAEILLDELKK